MKNQRSVQFGIPSLRNPPRVFISYTHDSAKHKRRVLNLANRLRSEGVDAILDQYEQNPVEGWTLWMEKQIRDADFVLLICTETYYRRVMKEDAPGIGLGGSWEAHIIYQYLFDDGTTNWRFLPVQFSGSTLAEIPRPLRAFARYNLENENGYKALYYRLTNQQPVPKPPLGRLRTMPISKRARGSSWLP